MDFGYENYMDEMKRDIREAIRNRYNLADYENREELEEALNDELWIDDNVTGNASGSYTFNSYRAQEKVLLAADLLKEIVAEWCMKPADVAEHFLNGDWEYFDVTIRCYLLGQAISAALDDMEEELKEAWEEEEEEEEEEEAAAAQ